jgi:transposase
MARYRCSACGNRTRFDVLSTRRTRAFHHFDLGGSDAVEQEEVLSLVVESVTCRWCGSSTAIEILDETADAGAGTAEAARGDISVG